MQNGTNIHRPFQLTRPVGGEPVILFNCNIRDLVSTHSPRGGRTIFPCLISDVPMSFNSLAPRGANPTKCPMSSRSKPFQLTRPAGGANQPAAVMIMPQVRFNSLAPRGANQMFAILYMRSLSFQLTRPAGGEPFLFVRRALHSRVSTHSPRGGRTIPSMVRLEISIGFNSLAPRGANHCMSIKKQGFPKVSTHSPRGGRTRSLTI